MLLLACAVGFAVRYAGELRAEEVAGLRSREREELARELHDTVAHHVSAIAVRAQAGRVVAATRPEAAVEALSVIEEEAARALEEMRSMVGTLRDGDRADLRPQQGVRDLRRLERHGGGPRPAGGGDDRRRARRAPARRSMPPASASPRKRSPTPLRHARQASEVQVRVDGDDDHVRVTVVDDGRGAARHRPPTPGFGLVGMAERAKLLGGTFDAGPRPGGGWTVEATLPRRAATDMTIRVLIADDQDIVRTGLRMILDAQPGIEVVGEAADGREALELARRLRPDVCLFDIRMPELDGIELTRRLAGPDVADPLAIVVITTFDLDEYVHGALKAGARGFLLKDAGPELLAQAVRSAASGDALIAPSVTARLLSTFAELGTSSAEPPRPAARPAHRARGGGARDRRPWPHQRRDRR